MIEYLTSLVNGLTLRALLLAAADISIVAYLIYRVLLMIRGTRAAQMIAGMVLVGVAYLASTRFELGTLAWLLDNLLQYFIILIIVVFQDDIRRALSRMGRRMFLARRQREEMYLAEEVVRAVERMARLRMGALIVFEREASLDEFIQPGTEMDAKVSRELLWSIFRVDAENPVHDGAVIIRNLRIYQAGALLPLSQKTELERNLGTRHRSGLGITEETDAVVVVVSEERGSIAVCHLGQILLDVKIDDLRSTLQSILRKDRLPSTDGEHPEASPSELQAGDAELEEVPAEVPGRRG